MDWLKTILKAAGLDDTKVDSIVGDAGKELPKHFVPKSQYNDLSETKKKLEKDITDRDAQLETLSKDANASEGLKAEITKLQGENKTAKEKYEADLKDMTLNNAITSALNGKVHNEKHVTGLIDKEKLVIGDDGKVVGLDEQLKILQTSDAYLFKTEDKGGGGGGFKFKGTSLLDGKDQSKGEQGDDKVGSFGKQLAESAKGNEGLDTARESYFK
ncbi:phage scaffolding protein [Paenibacillus sp. FSL H7-0323]|uniref:phage scaffolding protein n=1 Tax=Paenibacillus sp. FSL H7-0323 TaxID=2921433 RepID=UPI0030F5F6D9